MQQPFPDSYNEIADSMGIGLYQMFSLNEASLFLRCQIPELEKRIAKSELNCIKFSNAETQFFGYQLLEYILENVTHHNSPAPTQNLPERILRMQEVIEITGISRTTIWRMERKGEFPTRVRLSENSVGWKLIDIQKWINKY
jgi:predicted DNA-binding transcriptional regulator AlpA